MKSKKAEDYIDAHVVNFYDYKPMSRTAAYVVRLTSTIHAVELAEQETEERMREKAVEAFCSSNCPNGCSFGREEGIGCGAKYRFIQKLKNDGND